jgi:hypothetical protein
MGNARHLQESLSSLAGGSTMRNQCTRRANEIVPGQRMVLTVHPCRMFLLELLPAKREGCSRRSPPTCSGADFAVDVSSCLARVAQVNSDPSVPPFPRPSAWFCDILGIRLQHAQFLWDEFFKAVASQLFPYSGCVIGRRGPSKGPRTHLAHICESCFQQRCDKRNSCLRGCAPTLPSLK